MKNKISINILFLMILSVITYVSCKKFQFDRVTKISTIEVSAINKNVFAKGDIWDINTDVQITEYGFCWGDNNTPTINDNKKAIGSTNQKIAFKDTLKNIPVGNKYIRAYTIDEKEIKYGEAKFFNTGLPYVQTNSLSCISDISATAGGIIISDGGFTIQAKGLCWGTDSMPTLSNSHSSETGNSFSFTSSLLSLSNGTTYYIRAYATNVNGTFYGNKVSFSTLPKLTDITVETAWSGNGYTYNPNNLSVTFEGWQGASNRISGYCWSTIHNLPTICDNSKLSTVSVSAHTTCVITNLIKNATYYVRAYEIANGQIGYGEVKSFIAY